MRKILARKCEVCCKPIARTEGETAQAFYQRPTCGARRCLAERRARIAESHAPAMPLQLQPWPPWMWLIKPFADDVCAGPFTPTRLPGPVSLIGGCSSSSGWNVGGRE
jgi:hypothetical protein